MNGIITFSAEDVASEREAVLKYQGVPEEVEISERIKQLFVAASSLYANAAAPKGVLAEVDKTEFEAVYQGEGQNERKTPVADIFSRADGLALFAVTLGQDICGEIDRLFKAKDPPLACMLDSMASAATERLTALVERRFHEFLQKTGKADSGCKVLAYSPGYCGWHVSGQRRLFEHLCPERIGITLRESFLMEPLKSVSGVMIAGPRRLHSFSDSYPCCNRCETHGCRERVGALPAG